MCDSPLKAYMVDNWSAAHDEACFLVFAHSRNQARYHITHEGWGGFEEYVELSAIRKPAYDRYATGDKPYTIETNDDLPDGVEFYHEPGMECL